MTDFLILTEVDGIMDIKIILFGQLCEIAGGDSLLMKDVADTNALQELLKQLYPVLAASKYLFAVDRQVVQEIPVCWKTISLPYFHLFPEVDYAGKKII